MASIKQQLVLSYTIAGRLRKAGAKTFTTTAYRVGLVSITMGTALTLIAFLVMRGFQQQLTQKLTGLHGHLHIVRYTNNRTREGAPVGTQQLQGLPQLFPDHIQMAHPIAYLPALLRSDTNVCGTLFKGLHNKASHTHLRPYITQGQFITWPAEGYSHTIVLSQSMAQQLAVGIGDSVLACFLKQPPRYRKLQVAGIYATHVEELDTQLVWCDLGLIQRINGWPAQSVGGYEVFLKDIQQVGSFKDKLLDWLDYDLTVQTTQHTFAALFDWLSIIRQNVIIFTTLILLVISSNLAAIILIQLMERTAMVGLLRTLGATPLLISLVMVWNNLRLLMQGLFWGNMLGLGIGALQHHVKLLTLDPASYYVDHVPIAWDWPLIGLVNLVTIAIISSMLAGTAMIAAKLTPRQAILFR